eukprot:s1532_g3.t2
MSGARSTCLSAKNGRWTQTPGSTRKPSRRCAMTSPTSAAIATMSNCSLSSTSWSLHRRRRRQRRGSSQMLIHQKSARRSRSHFNELPKRHLDVETVCVFNQLLQAWQEQPQLFANDTATSSNLASLLGSGVPARCHTCSAQSFTRLSRHVEDADGRLCGQHLKQDTSAKTSTAMATAQVRGAMEGNPESRFGSCSRLLHSETWMKGWQWIGVIVCAISYYAGITRALFLISPPDVLKTEPVVERSNLQLIHYLAKVGMPLASFMVVTFSVIIPMFKFITTFLVMHPPASVSRDQHAKFCKLLCALSPYQMSDIFLVMLILAYLNTGFSAGCGHRCWSYVVSAIRAHFRTIETVLQQICTFSYDRDPMCHCCTLNHIHPKTGKPMTCDRLIIGESLRLWFGSVGAFEAYVQQEVSAAFKDRLGSLPLPYSWIVGSTIPAMWLALNDAIEHIYAGRSLEGVAFVFCVLCWWLVLFPVMIFLWMKVVLRLRRRFSQLWQETIVNLACTVAFGLLYLILALLEGFIFASLSFLPWEVALTVYASAAWVLSGLVGFCLWLKLHSRDYRNAACEVLQARNAAGYECTLCSGFESFFVYCFVSIVVAQILEVEHAEALEEAVDPQSNRSQPAQVGNEEAPSSPAPSSPQDELSERPGIYAILRSAAVVPTVHLQNRAHVMLRAGDLVEVTEVVYNKDEMRLRGRTVNPPGWINILDLDDGHRWAERQEDAPDVEGNLVRLLVFVFLWVSCIFTLLVLPAPPMSLQARSGGVGGVIVYRQEPTLSRLFDALWMQSPLFSGLMVLVLMVTPALFLCVAFARIMLFRHFFDPIWARRLWYLEQLLKPWVMGDVAAVSITSLFLSIQEPSTDFVFLCVRLAQPPVGFLACLGQGVACWGMRWCALPLRPGREAAANSSSQRVRPMDEAAESKAPLLLVAFDTAAKYCQPAPKQGGAPPWTFSWLACLVWRELFVWLFWFTIFWRLGPSEPPFVHSLEDLNVVLRGEVPRVNMLLMEHIPSSIGDCWAVKQHHLHLAEDYCKPVPMVPLHVPFEDLSARVVFIDGISSLRIMELQVLPENRLALKDAGPFSASFDNGQRWAIKIKGEFSDLKIWAEATKGNEDLVDGYICCHRPYHVGLQLSMLCRDPEGFAGNLTVDNFQIDPVSLNTRWADGTPAEGEQSTFEIEMGGNDPDLIHQAIKKHLESAIVAKTGGATPVKAGLPPFALSSLLNKLLRFNGGTHCPRADGA